MAKRVPRGASTRPSMQDVAELAGVSKTTVSFVLNNVPNSNIPEETKERVWQAIRELGYRPNQLARSMRQGQTKTLGMVVPDSSNPFFAEVGRGVEDASFEQGYSVILCNTEGDADKEHMYVDLLVEKQVDGLLFVAAGMSTEHLIHTLQASRVPIVVTDREISGVTADSLGIDNIHGGRLATKHLIDLGHSRIGCIAGPASERPSAGRVVGYRQALQSKKLPVDETLVLKGDWQAQGGHDAALCLLNRPDPPTAIFACNDMMALGAISAAVELGLRVPDDLSVIGFDDIVLALFANPPLTTIHQPKYEIGVEAVAMLMERIQEPQIPLRRKLFKLTLQARKSTAPAPRRRAG